MQNCMIGFPNNIDAATLSGGSFTAGLPRSNLQTRKLRQVARTSDASKTSTFVNINLGRSQPTRALALVNHNFSTSAKYRIRASGESVTTNYIGSSEDFGTWWAAYFIKPDITKGYASPDGKNNATRCSSKDNGVGSYPNISGFLAYNNTGAPLAGPLAVSIYARCVSGTLQVSFGLDDNHFSDYTLTTEWQRLIFIYSDTTAIAPGNRILQILEGTANNVEWDLFGAQVEPGLAATSYYPTYGAPLTVRPAGYMDTWQTYDYDSGWLDVWPVVYPYGSKNWEDPSWFGGKYSKDEIAGYTPSLIHLLNTSMLYQYWRIDIDDTSNTSGYLQWGRMFMGPVWQPVVNMSYGASIAWETQTDVQTSLGGNESYDVKLPYRVQKYKLDAMTRDEALSNAFEIQRRAGIDKEILWIADPDDTVHALRTRFLGRLRTLNTIEYPYFDTNTTAFEIKELQ